MRKRLGTPAIRIIRTQPRGSQEIEKRGNDDRDDHVRVISPFFNSLLEGFGHDAEFAGQRLVNSSVALIEDGA
jgi:hypothetical protein